MFQLYTTVAGNAASNVKLLAQDVIDLYSESQSLTGNERDEADYRLVLLIDRLIDRFPRSLEAQLLKRAGRLPKLDMDIAGTRARADAWAARHPDRAAALAKQVAEDDAVPRKAVVTNRPKDPNPSDDTGDREPADTSSRRTDSGIAMPPRNDKAFDLSVFTRPKQPSDQTTPPIDAGPARKVTRDQVRTVLRRASVLVYFVGIGKSGGLIPKHIGSGSFIAPDLVLTNAHVVEAMAKYKGTWIVINETIGIREAKVISNARQNTPIKIDAAVFRVPGFSSPHYLRVNSRHRIDEWIGISGYPGDASRSDERYDFLNTAIARGTVPSKDQIPTAVVDEGRLNNVVRDRSSKSLNLQYTMLTAGGNSGSPIVNACGEIIGLHYAGSTTKVKYNIAVHAKDVQFFLRHANIGFDAVDQECQVGG